MFGTLAKGESAMNRTATLLTYANSDQKNGAQAYNQAFDRLDANGDGQFTLDEINAAYRSDFN